MKEKSILKLVLNGYGHMILAGIVCFVVSASIAMMDFSAIVNDLLTLVLIIPVYIALLYPAIWTEGDRNRNMVQFGHLECDPYKGLKIGLFLAVPYLLQNVFLTLSWFKLIPNIFWLYKILNAHIWPILTWLNPLVGDALVSTSNMPVYGLMICWLLSAYPVVISAVAYFLGFKGISVSEKLIYQSKPRKRR